MRELIRFAQGYFHGKVGLQVVELGAEVGVNAMNILSALDVEQLNLVDIEMNQDLFTRIEPYRPKVAFHKMTTEQAAAALANRKFDLVYVDADHSYDWVKKDVNLWFPLVKRGGIIGGHDFGVGGVYEAVNEFIDRVRLKLYVGSGIEGHDWWVVKSKEGEDGSSI